MLRNLREAFHGWFEQFKTNEGDGLQGLLYLQSQFLRREGGRRLLAGLGPRLRRPSELRMFWLSLLATASLAKRRVK